MGRFNLIDEKWIAVIDNDDKPKDVSLSDLFQNAPNYRRLAGDMETQNFAIMRVLLAILLTVFTRVDYQGEPYEYLELDEMMRPKEPVDEDDSEEYLDALDKTWEYIWKAGRFPNVITAYLKKWHNRFYLLDTEYPFYQVTKEVLKNSLKVNSKGALEGHNAEGKQINRLISESGNKIALFSPMSKKWKNRMTEAELARWLIMMQGYYGTADKEKPKINETVKLSKGWLYDIGGIYLEGNSVFETLMLNTMLRHPENNKFSLNIQHPCWESLPKEWVEGLMRQKPIDNLASLYTNWCRAVYINPEWQNDQDVSFGIVKLAEINKANFFLEPMTLWKKQKKENYYTPKTLEASQALWRSFGLITITDDASGMKRPEIIDYLYQIKKYLSNHMISIRSVGMRSDENATSWLPKDEITDVLQMNEMIVDEGDDGWINRINDVVNDTKMKIDFIYQSYLQSIKEIKNAKKSLVDNGLERAYQSIDLPFREWLSSIKVDDSKEEKISEWNKLLKNIILDEASSYQKQLLSRDLIINKNNGMNLPMAYNMLRAKLK